MKFLLSSLALVLTTATLSNGHCWPCQSDGTAYFKNVGQCMKCCEALKFVGYKDQDGTPPFRGEGSIQEHREHCKEKHCRDWAKYAQGSCAVDIEEGGITGWCPFDHRCDCDPDEKGATGCVYGGTTWAPTGCRKQECP